MKKYIVVLLVLAYIAASSAFAGETGNGAGEKNAESGGNALGATGEKEGTLTPEGTIQKQGEEPSSSDDQGKKTDEGVQEEVRVRNEGEESNLTVREEVRTESAAGINMEIRIGNLTQEMERTQLRNETGMMPQDALNLRERLQERVLELNRTFQNLSETKRDIYMNQSRINLAVHAFLDVENMTGWIAGNVSEIARGFNESLQATIRAEERIRDRSGLTRFFFGGDAGAADDIEKELERYRERIQELNYIAAKCECDAETRTLLKEQLRLIEEEQKRLQNLADKEKKDKGLIGWLWQ